MISQVSFWAPHEAHITIAQSGQSGQISAKEILTWATVNTVRSNIEAMTAWVAQGFCYARKQTAQQLKGQIRPANLLADSQIYVKLLHFDEALLLQDLYDKRRETTPLTAHIASKTGAWLRGLVKEISTLDDDLQATLIDYFDVFTGHIKNQCKEIVKSYKTSVQQLDEEQERELEQEQEEECQLERPAKQNPHKPVLHPRLRGMIESGDVSSLEDFARSVGRAFEETSLRTIAACHTAAWDSRLYVTKEFTKAVNFLMRVNSADEYQHHPNAVLVVWEDKQKVKLALVLSDFEANALLPLLRATSQQEKGTTRLSLHHVVRRTFPDQPESLLTPLSFPSRVVNDEWRQQQLRPLCAQLAVLASSLFHAPAERAHVLRFLGLIPPPRREKDSEIDSEQWQSLRAARLIGSDGFVNQDGTAGNCSERTLQLWRETKATTKFQESPIEFIKGVAGLRNLLDRLAWSQVGSWVDTM